MTPLTPGSIGYFEDIIDGYFPLQTSLGHMLKRFDLSEAWVAMSHAPIFEVAGLPHDQPVPLTVRDAVAGVIDQAFLWVSMDRHGIRTGGVGQWRWFDHPRDGDTFDPMTRLAEPVFLRGIGMSRVGANRGHSDLFPRPSDIRYQPAQQLDWPAWIPVPAVSDATSADQMRIAQALADCV